MKSKQTGGCTCGSVRYETQLEPEFSVICHCRQCQRTTGTGHAASFAVIANVTTVTGDIQYYDQTSDDGNTTSSGFCKNCGNPVIKKSSGYPQYLFFHAATLDDPSSYKPQMVVYSEFKQPWDFVDPKLRNS